MSVLLWYAAVSSSGSTVTSASGSIVLRTCGSEGAAWPRYATRKPGALSPHFLACFAARSAAIAIRSPMVAAARGSVLPCATATRTRSVSPGARPPGIPPLLGGNLSPPTPSAPRSGMDAAFGLAGAGPAAAARIGAGLDPAGAGRAADGEVAVVDQGIDEHAVGGDVVVHLLLRPGHDRVDLDHLPPVVPLDHFGLAAVAGLVPAHAGDPRVVVGQRPLQRLHLAQVAAQVGVAPVQPWPELGILLGDGT